MSFAYTSELPLGRKAVILSPLTIWEAAYAPLSPAVISKASALKASRMEYYVSTHLQAGRHALDEGQAI